MPSFTIAREQSLYAGYVNSGIPTLRRNIAQYQEQLTTGKRVNRPSDDPSGFAQARSLEALERRYEGHTRTIGNARLWTDHTQSSLDQLSERFVEAYEKGIQGLNDTLGDDERGILADRIDAILAETVDELNTKVGDEYLFGGTRTLTQPIDNDPDSPTYGAQTGDLSGDRNRQISPDVRIAVNISGEDVLETGEGFSITESLQTLAAALRDPDAVTDPVAGTVSLEDAVAQVTTARDHLFRKNAEAGNIADRLNTAELRLADASTEAARLRSAAEDADYYEVVANMQKSQATLEAALRSTASISQTTLLDYLR